MGLGYSVLMFLTSCFGGSVKTNPALSENKSNESMSKTSIYSIQLKSIEGETFTLEKYKGKKILLVNTASKCGFTPQYEDLEALYKKYGNKVVVLALPCNDFGGQEPGSLSNIKEFCSVNFHTTFPMTEKVNIKSEPIHPLYSWLSDPQQNGWNDKLPSWNFCKYLISENGELLKFYPSGTKPLSPEILDQL